MAQPAELLHGRAHHHGALVAADARAHVDAAQRIREGVAQSALCNKYQQYRPALQVGVGAHRNVHVLAIRVAAASIQVDLALARALLAVFPDAVRASTLLELLKPPLVHLGLDVEVTKIAEQLKPPLELKLNPQFAQEVAHALAAGCVGDSHDLHSDGLVAQQLSDAAARLA
eukprot:4557115-Prymnesium_polylepis.1